jgi:hypothetical protein
MRLNSWYDENQLEHFLAVGRACLPRPAGGFGGLGVLGLQPPPDLEQGGADAAADPGRECGGAVPPLDPARRRHAARRSNHLLVYKHGADVSYGMVRYCVAARKPEILVESGKAPLEAFVPQTHQPGHEAEVDFGDVTVRLADELVI